MLFRKCLEAQLVEQMIHERLIWHGKSVGMGKPVAGGGDGYDARLLGEEQDRINGEPRPQLQQIVNESRTGERAHADIIAEPRRRGRFLEIRVQGDNRNARAAERAQHAQAIQVYSGDKRASSRHRIGLVRHTKEIRRWR